MGDFASPNSNGVLAGPGTQCHVQVVGVGNSVSWGNGEGV